MVTNPTKVDIFDSLDRWLPTQGLNIPIILCFLLILTKATVDTFNTKNMSYSRSSDTYITKLSQSRQCDTQVNIVNEPAYRDYGTDGYEIIVAVVVVVISIYSEPDEVILHN
ncbi:hypothetical protein GQX74_002101 [Glossina fuscipes]|nr:hypothetical protein GQX74_002101 [Glossina fuscipes]